MILGAAMALAMAACTAEPAPQIEPDSGYKVLTITSFLDTDATKTSYAGEKAFAWSAGDRISVLCHDGSANRWVTFTAEAAGKTARFTAQVPASVKIGPLDGSFAGVALFPADEGHVYGDRDNIAFHLPATRDFRAAGGGHPSADLPMLAWAQADGSYTFKHLTGAAKFIFTGVPCEHVKFSFATTTDVKLNGTFPLNLSGDAPSWSAAGTENASERSVTYYADTENGSVSFYLPYASGTIWAWNHVTLENADTGEELYSNKSVKEIAVQRKQVTVLSPISLAETPSTAFREELSFAESDAVIANPERGLYKMVEYKLRPGGDWTSASTSLTDQYDSENTLVMTLFYLMDFVDADELSTKALDYIRSVFTRIRSNGKKAIVRFAYSNTHTSDKTVDPRTIHQEPSLEQLRTQIGQLSSILTEYQDVICVLQAGFIGTYGEWYYTTHFSTFTQSSGQWKEGRDFTVSGNKISGYENRAAVLDALLQALPESRQIALRTPTYKQGYLSPSSLSSFTTFTSFGTDAAHRLAFHNDAFLYGGEDMGTFHYSWEREIWKQQGAYLINGGEAPYSSTDVSQMEGYSYDKVKAAIFDYHYSYLHHDTGYHTKPNSTSTSDGSTLMRWWHKQGWMNDIKKWLGYRLFLQSATIDGEGRTSGSKVSVSVTLANSGSAPIINERPMKLVLVHGSSYIVVADLGDPRAVASLGSKTFTAEFTLPQDIASGDKLALWLPDNEENLQAKQAYSVRLANDSPVTWSKGYNIFYTF